MRRAHVRVLSRRAVRAVLAAAVAAALATPLATPLAAGAANGRPSLAKAPDPLPALTLVTLEGPGTAGRVGGAGAPVDRARLLAAQDRVLAALGADQPTYRWTTALNGFAAELTPAQVEQVRSIPGVALVEASTVRPLASTGRPSTARRLMAGTPRMRGGAGVVLGVVDSGIAPDSPVFADVPGLGRRPRDFAGTCQAGDDWAPDTCGRKLLGARWFVAGFGATRVRASESMSPRDVLGHGTQVASLAAGNAGVTVRVGGRDRGRFGGVAPQARIAAYKACWAAPDPADDGCSTADLVTAIDRAVGDEVDVLNVSAVGGSGVDTVQLALLGAAEDDVVVVGAAGNSGKDSYAAHPSPWVTTVGATVGQLPGAQVRVGERILRGLGRPTAISGMAVLASRAGAGDVEARRARQCHPGALDARKVAGKIVVCERGGIGRVDKSRAVAQADGVAMVLVNVRRANLTADFHSVPTVHLPLREGRALKRRLAARPRTNLHLARDQEAGTPLRMAPWSASGDPRASVLKPDVVASGDGALGALPPSSGGWGLFSGTSAAAARASGLAVLLRSRHGAWSATAVRSVLTSTASPLAGPTVLDQGSGTLGSDVPATHLVLEVDPSQWRRALGARRFSRLNLSSMVLPPARRSFTRRVTNVGAQPEYFSLEARGFDSHRVQVRPLAVRLAPGESATFRISVSGPSSPARLDDGQLVWRGARGGETRLPVALVH